MQLHSLAPSVSQVVPIETIQTRETPLPFLGWRPSLLLILLKLPQLLSLLLLPLLLLPLSPPTEYYSVSRAYSCSSSTSTPLQSLGWRNITGFP